MMRHNSKSPDNTNPPAKPRRKRFPVRCLECGQKGDLHPAVVSMRVQKNHDGRLYDLYIPDLPVGRCGACGAFSYDQNSDDRVSAALREHLNLLTPEQIDRNIAELGLTLKEAAQCLGIAAETLSRWLSGAMIQSRAMDNLLRVFFACPQVRENLAGCGKDRTFGVSVVRLASVTPGGVLLQSELENRAV